MSTCIKTFTHFVVVSFPLHYLSFIVTISPCLSLSPLCFLLFIDNYPRQNAIWRARRSCTTQATRESSLYNIMEKNGQLLSLIYRLSHTHTYALVGDLDPKALLFDYLWMKLINQLSFFFFFSSIDSCTFSMSPNLSSLIWLRDPLGRIYTSCHQDFT